jgi:hypothetical protein
MITALPDSTAVAVVVDAGLRVSVFPNHFL